MITQKITKELFSYERGRLSWRISPANHIKTGDLAGTISIKGYRCIRINNKGHYEHRIIFLMFKGYLPKYLDHIDGDGLNNNIENLRECTESQNQHNRSLNKNNRSGVKGVSWDAKSKQWRAGLVAKREFIYLGLFWDIETAAQMLRIERLKRHGVFANHG